MQPGGTIQYTLSATDSADGHFMSIYVPDKMMLVGTDLFLGAGRPLVFTSGGSEHSIFLRHGVEGLSAARTSARIQFTLVGSTFTPGGIVLGRRG